MKKTAAAAALAALSLGSAQAQTVVNLYGLADAFVGNVKTTVPGSSTSVNKVDAGGMTTSYWGFGGSEDLGGGLKAVFAFESFMRNDTGELGRFNGDPAFARNSFVGLEGGFGRVSLGRH
ncbi:MAG TPA: porin, partial [Burkholderiaceae bacterium]|nr:porin [Burkholderiaceae bacterium]